MAQSVQHCTVSIACYRLAMDQAKDQAAMKNFFFKKTPFKLPTLAVLATNESTQIFASSLLVINMERSGHIGEV